MLDAALATFAEHGVVGARLDDIRRRANASPSSIYHLFGGLEEVTIALLERTFERLFAHLTACVVPTRTAKGAVTALVKAHIAWVLDNRAEARVMYQAMSVEASAPGAARLAARKAEMLAPLVAHLSRFMEAGTLPAWSPPVFDVVVLGTTHEACRRFLGGAPLDPKWMQATLPRLAWASLAAR